MNIDSKVLERRGHFLCSFFDAAVTFKRQDVFSILQAVITPNAQRPFGKEGRGMQENQQFLMMLVVILLLLTQQNTGSD